MGRAQQAPPPLRGIFSYVDQSYSNNFATFDPSSGSNDNTVAGFKTSGAPSSNSSNHNSSSAASFADIFSIDTETDGGDNR